MLSFHYLEILLYVFPIFETVVINTFFRPYLRYKDKIRLSVADVVLPFLLVGIHLLSVYSLSYSLLPHFLAAVCIVGLFQTLYYDANRKPYLFKKFLRSYIKITFLMSLLFYYLLVLFRLYLLLRG